jgi:hypothetical protein
VFTDGPGADGRDAGDPGFGGRSSGERRTGGHRTDSPEPRDRDHAVDDREGNDTAGWERSGRPAVQETVAEYVAAPGPDIPDAGTADLDTGDPDAALAAGAPAAEAPTRAGEAPAAQAPAAQAPAGRTPANGRRPAQAPAQSPAQPSADERADEVPPRGRGKKTAGSRGRRSSVPSWDEIMLGNSRQPD